MCSPTNECGLKWKGGIAMVTNFGNPIRTCASNAAKLQCSWASLAKFVMGRNSVCLTFN